MQSMTIREAYQRASSLLTEKEIYLKIAEWMLKDVCELDSTSWLLAQDRLLTEEESKAYFAMLDRVLSGEPYQYVIGTQDFYGRSFRVNPAVLIPRPETEIAVDIALKVISELHEGHHPLHIVDVGTGSGALAITLALETKETTVSAIDISAEALEVAKMNTEALGARVQFYLGDLLSPIIESQQTMHLLVSNPPYIGEQEEHEVAGQVLQYEPRQALFAPEEGYYFYRTLIEQSKACYKGILGIVFEVGYKQAEQVAKFITTVYPQARVQIHKDLQGKDRVVSAVIKD